MVALFTVVGKSGSPCGLQHLGGEGVHERLKGVGALSFWAAAGGKGAVEGAVSDELTSGGYGSEKMNRVQFD
jgi:hypothetical protein